MVQKLQPIDTTFTPAMQYRASPLAAPLAVMVPVQGRPDQSKGDILSYSRGTQIVGYNYENANTQQGSRIVLFEPLYLGTDSKSHGIWIGGSLYRTLKYTTNTLLCTLQANPISNETAIPSIAWSLLARQMLVARWDIDNIVTGSSYDDAWLNGAQTAGGTGTQSGAAPQATASLGAYGDGTYSGHLLYAACDVDYVLSSAEIAALGTGTAPVSPDRVILHPEHIKFLWVPGARAASGSFTGSLTNEACSWDRKPYNSSTNPNGNAVINGDIETALGGEWAATSATLSRLTDTSGLAGFFDTAYLKVQNSGSSGGYAKQSFTGLAAGASFYISGWAANIDATSARIYVYSGVGGALTTTVAVLENSSTTAAKLSASVSVLAGHDSLSILCLVNGADTKSARFDNILLTPNLAVNGGMEGTYAGGFAPSWAAFGTATGVADAATFRSGAEAQAVVCVAGGDGVQQTITTVAGTWYMAFGWVKKTLGTGPVNINFGGNTGAGTTSASYVQVSTAFRATGVSTVLKFTSAVAADTFTVDDVVVYPMDSITLTATPMTQADSTTPTGVVIDGGDTDTVVGSTVLPSPTTLLNTAGILLANYTIVLTDGSAAVTGSGATALQSYLGKLVQIYDGSVYILGYIKAVNGSGVTIVSTFGGATQNWASKNGAFNTSAATFTHTVFDPATCGGTIIVKFTPIGWNGADGRDHYLFDSGPGNLNRIFLYKISTGTVRCIAGDTAGNLKIMDLTVDGTVLPEGTPAILAGRWGAGGVKVRLNATDGATASGTGSGVTTGVITTGYLGSNQSSVGQSDSLDTSYWFYPYALSDDQLSAEMASGNTIALQSGTVTYGGASESLTANVAIFGHENLVVSTAAVGVTRGTAFPGGLGNADAYYALCTVELAPVRYRYDGQATAPDSTHGHLLLPGDVLEVYSPQNLAALRFIREGAIDANVMLSYGR